MLWAALTLGLMGSLHCVGMCGPLAIAFGGGRSSSRMDAAITGVFYNIGRASTYALLGLAFGGLGRFMVFAQVQKGVSIAIGVLMIVAFFASFDIEGYIRNLPLIQRWYNRIRSILTRMMKQSQSYHPYTLGLANGLLPCGLVYLALAGALATGGLLQGMLFMFVFGLGTMPMLFVLAFGSGLVPLHVRARLREVIPYVTLVFGIFLCYRGVVVDMPMELDFWSAINDPLMCH